MNKPFKTKETKKEIIPAELISIILIVGFSLAAFFSIFTSPQLYQTNIHEGDIALKDIYAPYDFTYSWGIDEEKTEAGKKAAIKDVPYFLSRESAVEEEIKERFKNFFSTLNSEKKMETSASEKIAVLREKSSMAISDKNFKVLLEYPDDIKLEEKVLVILDKIFTSGFISDDNLNYLQKEHITQVSLPKAPNEEALEPFGDLINKEKLGKIVTQYVSESFQDRKVRQAISLLILENIAPNLRLDEKKTLEKREEIAKKITPIPRTWSVKKNELIIEKGRRMNAQHIAEILELRHVFKPGITPSFLLGVVLLFLLLGLIAILDTFFVYKRSFLKQTKSIAIILLNILFIIIVSDFIMRSPQPSYFIPMASIGMIITLFVGFNAAFLTIIFMSILISVIIGGGIELALILITGSIVGIIAIRDVRRRAKILWAGILVGLASFAAFSCIGLINGMGLDFFIEDGVWCIASGIFSSLIVMGLLPLFEYFFKIPTNISLLELSDLNHPLLKELALEAPGTYHHSIMVGNLAEAACEAIGANSLLARVGAYYHDIGKMAKAEYFGENEIGVPSKHADLSPSMSALIIARHVKEGVDLAKKYKLNNTIIDFITQHHGDSLISFFYQKALEKTDEGEVLEESDFRYPGPKPQTKESAIILLADAVEAASRSLHDYSPASIRHLVRKMINNKFIDGQLDECDLTLSDINKIADNFVRVLMAVFHTRLKYPDKTDQTQDEALKA